MLTFSSSRDQMSKAATVAERRQNTLINFLGFCNSFVILDYLVKFRYTFI